MTIGEVSEFLQIPVGTLYQWRSQMRGPAALRMGKHVRYPKTSLRLWLQELADREGGR